MTTNKQWTFMESMADPEYRRAFADEMVGTGLAFQIRRMRETKGWTQEEVARLAKKAQETISQWENPSYGRYSLSTLKQLAGAFDVALLVRFVSFGELADWTMDVTPHRLIPPGYEEERQLSFLDMGSPEWQPTVKDIEDRLITTGSVRSWLGTKFTSAADVLPEWTQTNVPSTSHREEHKNAIAA